MKFSVFGSAARGAQSAGPAVVSLGDNHPAGTSTLAGGFAGCRVERRADRRPESSPHVRAAAQNSLRFLRAARLPRVGPRGVLVACPVLLAVFVAMHPAHAHPGSAGVITVTAGPTFMDLNRNDTPIGSDRGEGGVWRAQVGAGARGDTSTGAARGRPAMVPAPRIRPPAGWQVQLGAFRSETRAAKARAALAHTLADLPWAGGLVIDDSKDDGLFRVVLANTFAQRGEAAATCAAIAARGGECFVARAPARATGAAFGAAIAASEPVTRPQSEEEAAGHKPVAAARTAATAPKLVLERLDTLEAENRQVRKDIEALKAERTMPPRAPPSRADPVVETTAARFVRTDSKFGYEVLDPTTGINRKQRLILERRNDGTLVPDSLHVHGAVTAIANFQSSNRNDKFGYLMRHPTAKNQVGDRVSEATIHSAQLGFTVTLGDWLTGHAVMLFDPEQSFGDGTNTDIDRNQLQMRRAYVLFGDRDKSPFYASLGKMAVPFGLTDTVNPFSASSVWHVFGGLANGVTVGYANGVWTCPSWASREERSFAGQTHP